MNSIERANAIRCIDYLVYGTIFTCEMFCPKIKLMFFPPPEKPEMSPGECSGDQSLGLISSYLTEEDKSTKKCSRQYIINHLISITVDIEHPVDGNVDHVW